jgi:alpha-mannosidase
MIVHMIGNSHIDPVWLWRWQAGVDEALATFRAAADRCDEYPEFIFTRGEAWLYRQVELLDPALFARVRALVARGQWHITGGQVVQPDLNVPTEMGLRRQFQHGLRYFDETFGVRPVVGFNVDSFGHPGTLPDILVPLGFTGYIFGRPNLRDMPLPGLTFRWRGVGGAEIIASRIAPAYLTRYEDLESTIKEATAAADPALGHALCFYGVGNHGGGPTKGHIEYILNHRHAFEGLELRFSTPAAFFEAIAPYRDRLPLVTTDLQHTPPGVYSLMQDIKQEQRRGEHLLAQCEWLIVQLAEGPAAREAFGLRLDAAWEDLLFTQFHDVLGGSSIPSAWKATRAAQGRARMVGEEILVETTRRWARRALPSVNHQQIAVYNADAKPWSGLVETEPWLEFDNWGERWLSDLNGRPIPWQFVQAESPQLVPGVLFPAQLDAGGHVLVQLRDDTRPDVEPLTSDLAASPALLSNSRLRVALDPTGLAALQLDGRDMLGAGGMGLELREDLTDAWSFGTDRFRGPVVAAFRAETDWIVQEQGPLRARAWCEGWIGRSRVRWTVSLLRDEPRMSMELEVLYGDRTSALQLKVPLAWQPDVWTCGLPGGQIDREAGGMEWPMQAWTRVTAALERVAVVSQDFYSASLEGGCWRFTLLRSPRMGRMQGMWEDEKPDERAAQRAWHTDQGCHTFAFTVICGGDLSDELLHRVARQAAQPPIVFDRYEGMDRPPWGRVPPVHLR